MRDLRVETYGDFWEAWNDEELDQWYDAINTLDESVDGVSLSGYYRMMEVDAMINEEMEALIADEAIPEPLTDEERENFQELIVLLMEKVFSLPEDVLAADYAEYMEYENDYVYNDMLIEEKFTEHFLNSDADGSGVLDRTEYGTFETAIYNMRVDEYGGFF